MFSSRFAWRSIAVAGIASLALSACGGGDSAKDVPKGDGVLKLGTILPQTGSLAFLGPPEFAGVDLAAKEINKAGGVLGKDVEVTHKDSGDTTTDIAAQSADALIGDDTDAIIGAASSGVSFQFMEKLHNAQVLQVSPANTSPDFTTDPKADYFYRTAPSDIIQGRVLADTMLNDGATSVGIIALQDSYGTGLSDEVEKNVTDAGGEVVAKEIYDPKASEFSAEINKLKEAKPDAIAIISFEEFTTLAPAMDEAGIGQDKNQWYLVDGNLSNYGKDLPKGFMKDVKGTKPAVDLDDGFQKRLLGVDKSLDGFTYSAEAYDAAVVTALAAEAAKSDAPNGIKTEMINVTKGGEKCKTFAACKKLIKDGKDIDYDGASGPIEWTKEGDVSKGSIGVYKYNGKNEYEPEDFIEGEI